MAFGRNVLGLSRIVGVTVSDNEGSVRVLEKLGLRFHKTVKLSEDDKEISLFASGPSEDPVRSGAPMTE